MKRISLMMGAAASVAVASLAFAQAPHFSTVSRGPAPVVVETLIPTAPVARPTVAAMSEPVAQALSIQAAPVAEVAAQVPAVPAVAATPALLPSDSQGPKADDNANAVVVAPQPPAPPVITLVAKIDLATQRVTVSEHGTVKFTWMVSSGAKGFDTPRGIFQPEWMAKDWYSRKYDNAPMPFSVFFKDGAAIHATMNLGSLGTPASHGCVRLSKTNAAIFFSMVQRHGMKHTRIHVYGKPRHAPDLVASQSRNDNARAAPVRYASAQPGPRPMTGGYGGYNSYNGYGSAVARPTYAPPMYQSPAVRVVQYGGRRY
jgi:lipoprotein-anchoring transpeptidase ErfK/SrfK